MRPSTHRRRQAKRPSSRFARSKRIVRNEKLRGMNHFGKRALSAFIGLLFIGFVLIFRPPIHVTVSPEAVPVIGALLSGTVFRLARTRRHQH